MNFVILVIADNPITVHPNNEVGKCRKYFFFLLLLIWSSAKMKVL